MQTAAKVAGLLFLAVGVLGFVPGLGVPLEQLGLISADTGSASFGIVGVSLLLNVVHVAFGITGLFAARAPMQAQSFLIVGGGLYGVLFLVGCVLAYAVKRVILVDGPGGWVQLIGAVAMITLGILLRSVPFRVGTVLAGPNRPIRERPQP